MTQHQTVIAIDPGKTGAIAVFGGGKKSVHDIPSNDKGVDSRGVADLIRSAAGLDDVIVVLEDVSSMPTDGHVGAFRFGRSKGILEGVCAAMGLPVHYVTPSKWKKEMGLSGIAKNLAKDAARRKAMDLYPKFVTELLRKQDHNRAEAVLLAHWYLNVRK